MMTVCKAFQEPSDPACLPQVLLLSGIGAGAGAAAGAAVDALLARRTLVRFSVRF
jgi:hypothetical protein